MNTLTSLDVSKRLQVAGFHSDIDGFLVDEGDGMFKWKRDDPLPRLDRDGLPILESYPAYRSDTLLEWLVTKNYVIWIAKPHNRVLIDITSIEKKRSGMEADTLPDAIAEVILKVLKAGVLN